jgi:glycosyltransferase involved in cell wall biosynthesis
MRIFSYWPHPHRTALPLLQSTLREGDELTVLALPSLHGEVFPDIAEYEVLRTLPDPTASFGVARKPEIAIRRAAERRHVLKRGFDVADLNMLAYHTDWLDLRLIGRRTPLVSTVHDVRPHERQLPRRVQDRILRSLYRSAGELIVYHDALREELLADFGVDADRVHVIPHALDSSDRRGSASPPDGPPIVLFFGTFRQNKGLDILFDAIELLGESVDAQFIIAGSGPDAMTQEVERRSHLNKLIRCEIGRVSMERKHQLFCAASVVVLPYTQFHSMSGVLADAYAYRLPVVATDVGAIGPSVREHKTGIVVPPSSPVELAVGLECMLTSDRTRYRGHLEAAARRHDFSVVGPMIRDVYDVAVGRRS